MGKNDYDFHDQRIKIEPGPVMKCEGHIRVVCLSTELTTTFISNNKKNIIINKKNIVQEARI